MGDTDGTPAERWGALIREVRLKNGMTQDEFASAVSVARKTVVRWEAGAMVSDYDKIARVARRFQMPMAQLFAALAPDVGVPEPTILAHDTHPLAAELARMLDPDSRLPDDLRAGLEQLVDMAMEKPRQYLRQAHRTATDDDRPATRPVT